MTQLATTRTRSAADQVLESIIQEIAVPLAVLDEAKRRRDLVLDLAMQHDAARAQYASGSVAHGTENKPLEDADGGIKVNRRYEAFRVFGPDAPGGGEGPERFIRLFSQFILPRLQDAGYPNAEVDLTGNRAIKFVFNEPVDIDEWGEVDPYVDFIVGLSRADGQGLWIPNRRENGWDSADPERHTWLMTKRDPKPLRVHRARVLRLAKRAVKRDDLIPGRTKVMCSWNLSALALDIVESVDSMGEALARFFEAAASEIATELTPDPSPAVEDPINLPEDVSRQDAADRLWEMAQIVRAANAALSPAGARIELKQLFGDEIEAIRAREQRAIDKSYSGGNVAALATTFGQTTRKRMRSDGHR